MKRVAVLAALVLAGCGANQDQGISAGGKVIGGTVTVYSLITDPGGAGRDFVDGEKLALSAAGGRAGGLAANLTSLHFGGLDDAAQAEASRRAINDTQIIAAVVDATRVTVPLFNAAGILQVSPGDVSLARDPNLLPSGNRTVESLRGDVPPDFRARFSRAFGRPPSHRAQDGYRAMSAIVAAIKKAGAAGNDRTRVIESY